ncbi:MAG: DMT family transporter [Sphingomonadaceae bacterium]|nr:DMT family transporter [Sphingomonadaceae bacterium]
MSHRAPHSTASGLLFAIAGFAILSVGDGVIKSIAGAWPGLAVAALRYVLGALGLLLIVLAREGRAGLACPMPWVQLGRGACVAVATMSFFTALFLMPLAEATVVMFTAPVITALLSALFLREPASRATWAAIAIAFAGVLIVLRPNVATLGWAALLPLAAATAMGCLMILNRMAAEAGSALHMQLLISAFAAPILVVVAIAGHASGVEALEVGWPAWRVVARCALVAVTASVAHMLIYLATTRASAAVTAPATYVQLLVAGAIGVALFHERPDLVALGGAALIIVAGLVLWGAQRRASGAEAAS